MENRADSMETCWIPNTASMTSLTESISRLAPSRSFLSTTSLHNRFSDASMPSWPSSILCRSDDLSPGPSPDQVTGDGEVDVTPKSMPKPVRASPLSAHSPITIDSAVQVDEFGRIIMTVKSQHGEKEGRQVHFKDTLVAISAPSPSSPIYSSVSMNTLPSMASKDTFGNQLDPICHGITTHRPEYAAVGDDRAPSDAQTGTPLLLTPSTVQKDDASSIETLSKSNTGRILFCFPALCQAASSMTSLQDQFDVMTNTAHFPSAANTSPVLMSPIELSSEKTHPLSTEAPKAYKDDIIFAPWRRSRQNGLPASKSDGKLLEWVPKQKMKSRVRADSDLGVSSGWDHESSYASATVPIAFPNPHASIDLSKVQGELYFSPLSTQASMSDASTTASAVESHSSVRSILEQQRSAMEKLSQAGFWQQKTVEKGKSHESESTHYGLSTLPQEELVNKVYQWAWLLSSEAEKGHGAEEGIIVRPSSPTDCPEDEKVSPSQPQSTDEGDRAEGKKSWEWLASEDEIQEESFESNETIHNAAPPQSLEVSELGLVQTMPTQQIIESIPIETTSTHDVTLQEDDSVMLNLNQRESVTTAAIEALLTQLQTSQDPDHCKSRGSDDWKVGTSYLYRQMLKNIAEEDNKKDNGTQR
jgi:hypothetical protein